MMLSRPSIPKTLKETHSANDWGWGRRIFLRLRFWLFQFLALGVPCAQPLQKVLRLLLKVGAFGGGTGSASPQILRVIPIPNAPTAILIRLIIPLK